MSQLVLLGLCLSSVACTSTEKKMQDAAEESCAQAIECFGGDTEDEDECISEMLEDMEDVRAEYGDECFNILLDVQECITKHYTCVDEALDGSDIFAECANQLEDVVDVCGRDFEFDADDFDRENPDDFDDD